MTTFLIISMMTQPLDTFVDLGAFHPVTYQYLFIIHFGLARLNVDASQQSINQFNRHRPGDRNVCVGVSERQGQKRLRTLKRWVQEIRLNQNWSNNMYSVALKCHVQRS